jgi:hypothetical protein
MAAATDDIVRFCRARARSGSGLIGGGTGSADLRGRRLAGCQDQGGATDWGTGEKTWKENAEEGGEEMNSRVSLLSF